MTAEIIQFPRTGPPRSAGTPGQTWERLALLHHNAEIADEVIDYALATLAPVWMPPQVGWQQFEELTDALLRLQTAEDPAAVLDVAEIGPDHTPETYVIHCRGLVEDALHKLTGRRK